MLEYFASALTIGAFIGVIVMGSVATIILPAVKGRRKLYFIGFYLLVSLFLIVCVGDFFAYEKPKYILLEKIIAYLEYLIASLLFLLMTSHLLYQCGEKVRKSIFFRVVLALWLVYFVLLLIAQFTDKMYYITPENTFVRGPLHFLLMIPLYAILTLDIIALIHYRKRMTKRKFVHFAFYLFPIEIALVLHPFFVTMLFIVIATVICSITLYVVILTEQIDQYKIQQKEILDQRSKITVLQMRPHFIYNTMTSIYYLCEQDPKKAQQVTLDFTNYLRKIFNAVVSEKPIPFTEELEHTHAYINVVIAQIGDRLNVDFDTPQTSFFIPPLTLQPLVENSAKHGMNPDSEALSISVKTRKTDDGCEITVKDDGVGFDPESIKPNSTLANIRKRIEKFGGTLIIKSSPGETVVTIFIPFQNP